MKLPLSQIRDLEEAPDPEEDDSQEEAYHQEMMRTEHSPNDYVSFLRQAEKSLKSAQSLSWAEVLRKWG